MVVLVVVDLIIVLIVLIVKTVMVVMIVMTAMTAMTAIMVMILMVVMILSVVMIVMIVMTVITSGDIDADISHVRSIWVVGRNSGSGGGEGGEILFANRNRIGGPVPNKYKLEDRRQYTEEGCGRDSL